MPIHYEGDDFDPKSELGDWDGNLVEGDASTYPVLQSATKRFNRIFVKVAIAAIPVFLFIILVPFAMMLIPVVFVVVIYFVLFAKMKCPLCGKKMERVRISVDGSDPDGSGACRIYFACHSCHVRVDTGATSGA